MRSLFLAASAVALIAAPAFAQTSSSHKGEAASGADKTFIEHAAQGGRAEVELGKLAESHAQSPDVKNFAKRMVEDHGKANDQLKQIAQKEGVKLPSGMGKEHEEVKNRLEKLHGASFDQAYMHDMVQDHQKDVREFQQAANSLQDPQLKQFAQQTLSTIQQHLQMAEQLATAEGSSSAPGATRR
jgi:putative membrane protein